jgi:hypothetical protein
MGGDTWIDQRLAMPFERSQGSLFIDSHESAVAGNVGRQNGDQAALSSRFGSLLRHRIPSGLEIGVRRNHATHRLVPVVSGGTVLTRIGKDQ